MLRQIDDPFWLCVPRLQVSRAFRKESEHSFRLSFLLSLRVCWAYSSLTIPLIELKGEFAPNTQMADTEKSSIATFEISSCGPHWDDGKHCFRSDEQCETTMINALTHNNIRFQKRSEINDWGVFHSICVGFANSTTESCYVHDPDILEARAALRSGQTYLLQAVSSSRSDTEEVSDDDDDFDSESWGKTNNKYIQAGHLSFNWRQLMDSYFKEDIFVRKEAAKLGTTCRAKVDIMALMNDARDTITSECPDLASQAGSSRPLEGAISDKNIFYKARDDIFDRVARICNANREVEDKLYSSVYKHRLENSVGKANENPPTIENERIGSQQWENAGVKDHV